MMRRVGRSTIALTDKWDSAVGADGNEEWERQHYGFWKDIVRKACRQEHVRRDDERQIAQAICQKIHGDGFDFFVRKSAVLFYFRKKCAIIQH